MENLSPPLEKVVFPLAIPVPAYLRDHHVGGLAVLPAVEALQNVAQSKPKNWGGRLVCQERAVFQHLLVIEPGVAAIPALHEHARYADGRCLSRLTTLRAGRRMKFTRRMEHASVWFMPDGGSMAAGADPLPASFEAIMPEGADFMVSDDRLYHELVPFGPAYRNVKGEVLLSENGASAAVSGGDIPGAAGPLGSPFPLDAAMHAACVWGQRYRNRVVFPVGFDERDIFTPTKEGELYCCDITPLPGEGEVLRFDIRIYDQGRKPVEVIRGLRMRDISGGRLAPPAWIREGV